jgi:hypothetical protein
MLLKTSLALIFTVAFSTAATAQVNLKDKKEDQRFAYCKLQGKVNSCNFPSNTGAYSDLMSVELVEGSGSDVTICYFTPVTSGLSVGVAVAFSVGSTQYEKKECKDGVIGFGQYNQNPVFYNPYRGTPGALYRVGFAPHNREWLTKYRFNPE